MATLIYKTNWIRTLTHFRCYTERGIITIPLFIFYEPGSFSFCPV
jgi:hypothetical protein